jgi:AraC-like DNA-binding protein
MPEPTPESSLMDRGGEWRHQYAAVARAIAFIRANAARQPSLAEIAAAAHVSEFHLQRLFSAWAGLSPKRFLQYLTKEHAREALRASTGVLDAALDAGLSGPGRLHDLMVSCEALTPGEIRAQGAGVELRHGYAATPLGDALFGWTARAFAISRFATMTTRRSLKSCTRTGRPPISSAITRPPEHWRPASSPPHRGRENCICCCAARISRSRSGKPC